MGFWDILSRVSSICGVLSLIISLITLALASGINKSIAVHIEESDFRKDIEKKIEQIQAYAEVLLKDYDVVKKSHKTLFAEIENTMVDIQIMYSDILPKKVIKKIGKLNQALRTNDFVPTQKACLEYQRQINSINSSLRRRLRTLK